MVCDAISEISVVTCPTRVTASAKVAIVVRACSLRVTAALVAFVALATWELISRIELDSSSVALATVCALVRDCAEAAATVCALAPTSSADRLITDAASVIAVIRLSMPVTAVSVSVSTVVTISLRALRRAASASPF